MAHDSTFVMDNRRDILDYRYAGLKDTDSTDCLEIQGIAWICAPGAIIEV
jgi:hypothetical protein